MPIPSSADHELSLYGRPETNRLGIAVPTAHTSDLPPHQAARRFRLSHYSRLRSEIFTYVAVCERRLDFYDVVRQRDSRGSHRRMGHQTLRGTSS